MTPNSGRRFCRRCGLHIHAREIAYKIERKGQWDSAPNLVFWLCRRDAEQVIKAIEVISIPAEEWDFLRETG